jgi:hypothetical protein
MASERNLELLDDYLGNRLNADEKLAFEKSLEQDISLRKELDLQQRIVNGIRKARTAELKQMLNNVPVSSLPQEGPSAIAKVATWVVVAGLVSTGVYFYFRGEEAVNKQQESTTQTESAPDNINAIDPNASAVPKSETPAITKSEAAKTDASENSEPSPNDTPESIVPESSDPAIAPAARDVFDPSEEAKSNDPITAIEGAKPSTSATPSIDVKTDAGTRYDFHYQFTEDKLMLYGVFEKNLYEIMEFFSNNKRTMFLYYKDNYYLLNEENEKVKPLKPISDEALLKKLKDYRSAR